MRSTKVGRIFLFFTIEYGCMEGEKAVQTSVRKAGKKDEKKNQFCTGRNADPGYGVVLPRILAFDGYFFTGNGTKSKQLSVDSGIYPWHDLRLQWQISGEF